MSAATNDRTPTVDERAGVAWWNAMEAPERSLWLTRANGETVAEAWECYKRRNGMRLEIRRDAGGERHYAGDVAMHCGDPLLAYVDGQWVEGRYEANFASGRIRRAWFYVSDDAAIAITDDLLVQVDP